MATPGGVPVPTVVASYPGTTTDNWQAAEHTVATIGTAAVLNKIHSTLLNIIALVGTITVRLYTSINGTQLQCYAQTFTVAADGPGLWIINGTLAIKGTLLVTAQSNNAADNGQAIGWEYILEST
jgi:hypothetical protein